ncbi:MAG: F0F1 ATP synthase subunit delta [Burkholderiaceae bacterium]
MLIDWFTVGAQALNFIVLIWLLKRFLYQPVLDAVDTREARIAGQLADARAMQAKAVVERDALQAQSADFERGREALLAQAVQDAQAERERLFDKATQAADALAAKHRRALAEQAERIQQSLDEQVGHEVFAIARRALADLASASLESRIAELFILRLRALDPAAHAELAHGLGEPGATAILRSAFELPATQRSALQSAVDAAFGAGVALQFQTAPQVIAGIELEVGGRKLAWSIAPYLADMHAAVAALVEAPA